MLTIDLRVFETTLVTAARKPSFTAACERGEASLCETDDEGEDTFREIIDIHRARLRRIRPLSSVATPADRPVEDGPSDTTDRSVWRSSISRR